jgi:hypothetical protein
MFFPADSALNSREQPRYHRPLESGTKDKIRRSLLDAKRIARVLKPSLVGKPATLLNSPGGARSIRHCNCQYGSNSLIRERPRNFKLPDKWPALSLPDPSAARAVYCLRGVFLFQKFLTNRTGSLPHIRTWLSTCR